MVRAFEKAEPGGFNVDHDSWNFAHAGKCI